MIDPNVTLIALLASDAGVAAVNGDRIYSPRVPPGYKPDIAGQALSVSVRGGQVDYEDGIVSPSFQVVGWGITSKKARAAVSTALKLLHNVPDQMVMTQDGVARVLSGVCEVYPQDVTDSETGWFTSVSFFKLQMYLDF